MAKFERTVKGDFAHIGKSLQSSILAGDSSVYLVDESARTLGDTHVSMYVFSKFYLHEATPASLTLLLVGQGDEIFVSAIGAGVSPNKLEKPGTEDKLLSLAAHALEDIISSESN